MENEKVDHIINNALKPSFEPDAALNASIMDEIRKREEAQSKSLVDNIHKHKAIKQSGGRNISHSFMKAAALVLVLISVGTAGVYAANKLLNKTRVSEHGISTGGDYLKDEDLASTLEDAVTETLGKEEPSADDKWLSKETVMVSGVYKNVYFTYPDYLTLTGDTGFANNFREIPGTNTCAAYVITDLGDDTTEYSMSAEFITESGGSISFNMSYIKGNIADDASYGVMLNGTSNVREYTTSSGLEFTLADDEVSTDGDTMIRTTTLLAYDDYRGEIHFTGMTDEEIQEVLELIVIDN